MIVRRTVTMSSFDILAFVILAVLTVWYFNTVVARPYPTLYTNWFWGWTHGVMIVPDLIGRLVSDRIAIYQVPNKGKWYDAGYVIGVCTFFGPIAARLGFTSKKVVIRDEV